MAAPTAGGTRATGSCSVASKPVLVFVLLPFDRRQAALGLRGFTLCNLVFLCFRSYFFTIREQNKILEEKIKAIQYTKNDEVITRYNLEAIMTFIADKFENLAETYTNSTLDQKRTLLCSIFPSGLQWGYPGYSNTVLSPFYRSMLDIQRDSVPFGSP